MCAANVFRKDASPFAVSKTLVERRSPRIVSRLTRPFETNRSSTPVNVPFVTRVCSDNSEQVMPWVSPSVTSTSNWEGVNFIDLMCRLPVRQKAR